MRHVDVRVRDRGVAERGLFAAVALLVAGMLSGCLVAGYSSGGGWFLWPGGGIGLLLVVLLIIFLMRRR